MRQWRTNRDEERVSVSCRIESFMYKIKRSNSRRDRYGERKNGKGKRDSVWGFEESSFSDKIFDSKSKENRLVFFQIWFSLKKFPLRKFWKRSTDKAVRPLGVILCPVACIATVVVVASIGKKERGSESEWYSMQSICMGVVRVCLYGREKDGRQGKRKLKKVQMKILIYYLPTYFVRYKKTRFLSEESR